jgi:cytochrome c biogenesis protein CcmG/thiol:disulfide interchange protein DsbE
LRARGVLGLVWVLASCSGMEERFKPLAVGEPVPVYAVRTLAGDSARVGPSEPLTLINIWATWCVPCQQEFPDLERIHREYGPRGLRILAVSVDAEGDDAKVKDFVREYGATFTIGHDDRGTIRQLYQSIGVPESYLVAANGRLIWRGIGAFPAGAAPLRAVLDSVMAATSAATRS